MPLLLTEIRRYLVFSLTVPFLLVLAHVLVLLFKSSAAGIATIVVAAFIIYERISFASQMSNERLLRKQEIEEIRHLLSEVDAIIIELGVRKKIPMEGSALAPQYLHDTESARVLVCAISKSLAKLDYEDSRSSTTFGNVLVRNLCMLGRGIQKALSELSNNSNDITHGAKPLSDAAVPQPDSNGTIAVRIEENTAEKNSAVNSANQVERESQHETKLGAEGEMHAASTVALATANDIPTIAHTTSLTSERVEPLLNDNHRIFLVASIIQDIAAQIDLLALRAAIEAASAGEQGREFAMVADEARQVAERTSKATQGITNLLSSMQERSFLAVENMRTAVKEVDAGSAIKDISEGAREITEAVREISEAVREQSSASTAIAQQIERILEQTGSRQNDTSDQSDQSSHTKTSNLNQKPALN